MSRASAGVSEVTGGATAGAGTSIGGTAGEPLRPREPADLRAVLLRAVRFAGDLRAVDFFAVLFLAAVRLVAVLRAVDFLAAVLRAVVFLAVALFAVDLRAVVRFAAAGATSCPQPFLGNGTVLMAMLTPLARAFPHLRPWFVSRVGIASVQVAARVVDAITRA